MSRLTILKRLIVRMERSSEFERPYRERVRYPSVSMRGFAWAIDIVVSFLLALVVSVIVGVFSDPLGAILFLTIFIGYYIISEARWGRTVGKRLVGIRVVNINGKPISTYAAIIRNTIKLIGASSLLLILVGVVLIADSRYDQRLGDRLAKTLVIKG